MLISMSRITIVRHAQPDIDPSLDSSAWSLSSSGAAAAADLDLHAGPSTVLSTSPERKAVETVMASVRSERMLVDSRFREIDRAERVHDGFRDARRAWIRGRLDERHESWETPDTAARRFHDGLLAHPAEHLVVGTHGMVLTAWMVDQGLSPPGDAAVDIVLERQIDGIRSEVFYVATLMSIDPTLADGPEFDDPSRGAYEVQFVTHDELHAVDLRPAELKAFLLAQR
jgi:broad specificity phosphatase PhoE